MEAVEQLISLAAAVPVLGQVAPDIITRNLDIAEAKEISARLKATVPPEILAASDEEAKGFKQGVNPAQMQQIVGNLQKLAQELDMSKAQNQQLMEIIGKLQTEIESKEKDRQLDMAKAQLNSQTTLEKANIQIKPEMMQALMESVQYIRGRVEQSGQPQNAPAPAQIAG
jgi:hypothetical protein